MSKPTVGIITYRRPLGLKRLLDSLVSEVGDAMLKVIVVDNDSMRSAEEICRTYSGLLDLVYDVEPRRGVSHPRNKVLDLADGADAVIFLDDDEWVESGWWEHLLATSHRFPEAVVTGPVKYVLPLDSRSWANRFGYFQTPDYKHESTVRATGAGNTLIPAAALNRLLTPRFDDAFSYSGGEDHDLFERLGRNGCEIRWASGASVFEEVPLERATGKWMRQRSARSGYIRGRIMFSNGASSAKIGLHGIARLGVGAAAYVLSVRPGRDRRARARALATVLSGLGFIAAAVHKPLVAYGTNNGDGS